MVESTSLLRENDLVVKKERERKNTKTMEFLRGLG